jgi:choline dehydrogenase
MQLARRIYATEPMRSLVADETAPGPAVTDRAAFDAYVRKAAGVTQHPVGTCRMGSDNAAVLDPQLRVRGVEGLRVADASVMPTVPGGNTNAASIMIGEVAADLLRGRKLPPEYLRGEPPA